MVWAPFCEQRDKEMVCNEISVNMNTYVPWWERREKFFYHKFIIRVMIRKSTCWLYKMLYYYSSKWFSTNSMILTAWKTQANRIHSKNCDWNVLEFNLTFIINVERNALRKQIKRSEILGKCIFEFWHKTMLPAKLNQDIKRNERERKRRKEVWWDWIRWNKRTITLKKFYCALSTSIAKTFLFLQCLWHRFSLMIQILYKSNYLIEMG